MLTFTRYVVTLQCNQACLIQKIVSVKYSGVVIVLMFLVVLKDRNAVLGLVLGLEVLVLGYILVCDTAFFVSCTQTASSVTITP